MGRQRKYRSNRTHVVRTTAMWIALSAIIGFGAPGVAAGDLPPHAEHDVPAETEPDPNDAYTHEEILLNVDLQALMFELGSGTRQDLQTPENPQAIARIEPEAPAADPDLMERLQTSWSFGAWQVTNSVGQEIKSGALDVTPTLGYRHERDDGSIIAPRLSVKGVWDLEPFVSHFDDAQIAGFNAQLEGGVTLLDNDGWSVDASTSLGGSTDPGRSLEWRTNVGVSVPLN